MSVHSQIDIRGDNDVTRIHAGWGVPETVIATLREVAETGARTPQDIAKEFIRQFKSEGRDEGFALRIVKKDLDWGATDYRYTVDVNTSSWSVGVQKCFGYQLGFGPVPAVFNTVLVRPAPSPDELKREITVDVKALKASGASLDEIITVIKAAYTDKPAKADAAAAGK